MDVDTNSETSKVNLKDFMDKHFNKIHERFDNIEATLSVQQSKIVSLENKIETLEKDVCELKSENETLHKIVKKKNLIISGISENVSESDLDLYNKTTDLLKNQLKCDASEIDVCHRIGKPTVGKNRPVRVTFISMRDRENVWQKKLTTNHPVYINEDLPFNWKNRSITIEGQVISAKQCSEINKPSKSFQLNAQPENHNTNFLEIGNNQRPKRRKPNQPTK